MTRYETLEVQSLKRSISKYINRYPSPNKEINRARLIRLQELKPFISTNEEKAKEYYNLRDTIALSNGGFAMKYVVKYLALLNDESAINEMFQEAMIGLIEAIDTFDISKKTSFTTYSYFHVRKRIIDFIKHNKLVRAPRDIARNIKHVNDVQGQLFAINGYRPTCSEVGVELKKSRNIKLRRRTIENISLLLELNSARCEDSFISEFIDQVSTESDNDLFRAMETNIIGVISRLSEKAQKIIRLRYGIEMEYTHTLDEVNLIVKITNKERLELE